MKEYLNKKLDGSYELIVSNSGCVDGDWIEVPNGMNYAYGEGSFIQFTKQEMGYRDSVLVWQRTPSLNDQYAEIEQVRQASKDNVSNPSHYTKGKVECIDALESATIGKSGIEAVCVANVIKYLWRYEEKNGIEDVKKAQWYLERLVASMGS